MWEFVIKKAEPQDWEAAISVAWITFQQIAKQVSDENGIRDFRDGLTSTQLYIDFLQGNYPLFCAYKGKKIVGMLTLKNMEHISLFFVKKEYQRQGIGTELLEVCRAYCRERGIFNLTVNAASTGLAFYLANGFTISAGERFEGGLRFTPMVLRG